MSRRLLDLCCGAGGAGRGYADADYEVVGVDNTPQPRYPYEFHQADALTFDLSGFDVIHASPPCHASSDLRYRTGLTYECIIAPLRDRLIASGLPYVIENVEGAPLRDPIVLCGTMFPGLRVIRHRLFESNVELRAPGHHPKHPLVFTHDKRKSHYGQLDQDMSFVSVNGGGNCTVANARDAMGIDWMTKDEVNQAIPPIYAQYIGIQLRRYATS